MRTTLFFLVLVLTQLSYSQEQFDFRKSKWGMSKEQVKKSEVSELLADQDNVLAYNGRLVGYECMIGYIFVKNTLSRTKYIIEESASNSDKYDYDYNVFKNLLTEKYGKPKNDDIIWKDDYLKTQPSMLGHSIQKNSVIYYTAWETDNTLIVQAFQVNDRNVSIVIEYTSKKFQDLEKENILKDF